MLLKKLVGMLLFVLGMTGMLRSQTTGTISGTISGAPFGGIDVHIMTVDYVSAAVVFRDTVRTDLSGYYESHYNISAPSGKGWVWVSFDNCIPVFITDSVYWDTTLAYKDPVLDFDYCLSSSCQAMFTYTASGFTINLNNTSTSTSPPGTLRYTWSFGNGDFSNDSAPQYLFGSPGVYEICLHMVDSAASCYSTYCQSVSILMTGMVITGEVNVASEPPSAAMIYLMAVNNQEFEVVDSLLLNDTTGQTFIFPVNSGTYHLKAFLLSYDPDFGDYLPTYYLQSLGWTNSTAVIITDSSSWDNNIDLLPSISTAGNAVIAGRVAWAGSNAPYSGASILLTNNNGEGMAYAQTDEEGHYEFNNLYAGNYQVFVDIPGKTSYIRKINLPVNDSRVEDADFIVGEEYITTAIGEDEELTFSEFYPNPVQDVLHAELVVGQAVIARVMVLDLSGKVYLRKEADLLPGKNLIELEMGGMPAGGYVLYVITDNLFLSEKLIRSADR